jgi:SAM-dependent methyltransferase
VTRRPAAPTAKRYDRAYFDRWYRHASHRVRTPAELRRTVAMVVGVTEWVLERPLRSVLDVGCGEGAWQPALRRLRPGARYVGVDASAYAVARFGGRRNLRVGRFDQLAELGLRGPYDLVVCADVLHYLGAAELARGLPALAARTGGVAYVQAYTRSDEIEGDMRGFRRRSASTYRRLLLGVGLVPIGAGCWAAGAHGARLAALDCAVPR